METVGVDHELDPGRAIASDRIIPLQQGWTQDRVLRSCRDITQPFAVVGREGGDKHQADDVARFGDDLGDDGARVRVSDQEHLPIDLVDDARDVRRIGGQAA